jgi:hypothetical protein
MTIPTNLLKLIGGDEPRLNLLTHPLCFYPYRVAITTLVKICGDNKPGYLITSEGNVDIANHLIKESGPNDIKVAHYDDPTFPYLKAHGALVIFDSLYLMAGEGHNINDFKGTIRDLYEHNCQVIFIIDYGYPQENINKMVPHFIGKTHYINFDMIGSVGFTVVKDKQILNEPEFRNQCRRDKELTLSAESSKYITDILAGQKELPFNNFNHDILYFNPVNPPDGLTGDILSPKRFFNVVYPYNIARIIDEQPDVDKALYTIIRIFGTAEIFKFAPKIRRLYDTITMNRFCKDSKGAKHFILTGYPYYDETVGASKFGEYGGDLIYNILTYKDTDTGMASDAQFNPNQVARLYRDDATEIIKKFNEPGSDILILIANELQPFDPAGVNHFHILDTKLMDAFYLIDKLYKNCTEGVPELDIHLYPINYNDSLSPDGKDFKSFQLFYNKFKDERQARWDFEQAYPIFKGLS